MKKKFIFLFLVVFLVLATFRVYADSSSCNLQVSLVNQDPYPAVQGDTVKLLFQMSGVDNSACNGAFFKLDPGYAFSLTQNNSMQTLQGSTFTQNYNNEWTIPFTLSVNKDAPDGYSPIQVFYSAGNTLNFSKFSSSQTFNISVQDSRANFEVYVTNYEPTTNIITFQILNTAKVGIKALTIQIPEQSNIQVKGSNTNIVGDLDSNEYTTADFEGTPVKGNITLQISYTDQAGVRRTLQQDVPYDPVYFENRVSDQKGSPIVTWIIILVIIALIVYWVYRSRKKKRLIAERRNRAR